MNYLNYYDFLNGTSVKDYQILVGQTKKSFLIGPKITKSFDSKSFYLRIISNCIYKKDIYKKRIKNFNINKIDLYYDNLKENEIIELYSNRVVLHKYQNVPGEMYEKE